MRRLACAITYCSIHLAGERPLVAAWTTLLRCLGEVQQISIVLDLARLPIVLDDKVAEAVEDVGIAVLCPLPVLVATVVIEELIAHGKLCQQDLIAVGQLPVSMVGNDVELVDNGEKMCSLLVGQRTDGGVVELLVVVAEGVETEVVEHLRRYEQQGIAKVVGAIDRVHNMTRKNDGQVVFVMGDDPHVVHGPCAAAQDEGQDDVWEYEIFVVAEESWHLTHHQDVGFLNGRQLQFFRGSHSLERCWHIKKCYLLAKLLLFSDYARGKRLIAIKYSQIVSEKMCKT